MLLTRLTGISIFVVLFCSAIVTAQDSTGYNYLKEKDTTYVPAKIPFLALGASAILPGAGQIYNESYLKAPVVWGFLGWFAYEWDSYNKSYKTAKADYTKHINDPRYKRIRDFYSDKRDTYAVYIGLVYALNLVDAYVDAHLFDFDVYSGCKTDIGLSLKLKFNTLK